MCMPLSCYCQQTEALMLSLLMRPGWCGVIVGQDWKVCCSCLFYPKKNKTGMSIQGENTLKKH